MPQKTVEISTLIQLDSIRKNLSGNYMLINDILMGSNDDWEPVGSDSAPFIGSFNGNGYRIMNMRINAPNSCAGFFGSVENCTLENIALENISVTGSQAGGIAGLSRNTIIKNCYCAGSISSDAWNGGAYSGGIVGHLKGRSTISDCYSTVNINASNHEGRSYSGGIAGYVGEEGFSYSEGNIVHIVDSSTIVNCCSAGKIYSKTTKGDAFAGGIVGYLVGDSSVANCAAVNHHILGDHGHNHGATSTKPIVGCCRPDAVISNNIARESMTTSHDLNNQIHNTNKTDNDLSSKAVYQTGLGWDFENIWAIDDGLGLPTLKYLPKIVNVSVDGVVHENIVRDGCFNVPENIANVRFIEWNMQADGKGKTFTCGEPINVVAGFTIYAVMKGITRELPYEIYTPSDLSNVKDNLSWHCKLMCDISLSEYNDGEGWEPIGTAKKPFTGTFNGNGYVIRDLYINRTDEYIGLFGYIRDGYVRDTGLEIASGGIICGPYRGPSYAGGITGCLHDSTIINCYCVGDVTATTGYAGGIAAKIFSYSHLISSHIVNSYSIGNVTAHFYSGGIAGSSEKCGISSCYSIGTIISTGGSKPAQITIVGRKSSSKITNAYCGGKNIVNDNSDSSDQFCSDGAVGGIAGSLFRGEINKCFAINPTIDSEANIERIARGVGWNFDDDAENLWKISVHGKYPTLYWQK